MTPAGTVELANRLVSENIINSPEEFVDFLNNPMSDKNQKLIYRLYQLDQNAN